MSDPNQPNPEPRLVPSPADLAAEFPRTPARLFERLDGCPAPKRTPGQERAVLRDRVQSSADRFVRAVQATRGPVQDLDLTVELMLRAVTRLDRDLHHFVDALVEAEDMIPEPRQDTNVGLLP